MLGGVGLQHFNWGLRRRHDSFDQVSIHPPTAGLRVRAASRFDDTRSELVKHRDQQIRWWGTELAALRLIRQPRGLP